MKKEREKKHERIKKELGRRAILMSLERNLGGVGEVWRSDKKIRVALVSISSRIWTFPSCLIELHTEVEQGYSDQ